MMTKRRSVEQSVRDIRHRTRQKYFAEEKIRIVLEGLRAEASVTELCRREASIRKCTIAGQRNLWRPVENVYPVIPCEKNHLMK
tara:strand:+ start:172 stop:423 length:252 start_codon:yes stop_codon:yes gene_type:complete